jgi:hypothetical protein
VGLQLIVEFPTVTNLANLCNQQGAEIGNPWDQQLTLREYCSCLTGSAHARTQTKPMLSARASFRTSTMGAEVCGKRSSSSTGDSAAGIHSCQERKHDIVATSCASPYTEDHARVLNLAVTVMHY